MQTVGTNDVANSQLFHQQLERVFLNTSLHELISSEELTKLVCAFWYLVLNVESAYWRIGNDRVRE